MKRSELVAQPFGAANSALWKPSRAATALFYPGNETGDERRPVGKRFDVDMLV